MTSQIFLGKEISDNFNESGRIISKEVETWFGDLLKALFPDKPINDKFSYGYQLLTIRYFDIKINLENETIIIPKDISFFNLKIVANYLPVNWKT